MSDLIVEMDMPQACRWYEDGTTKLCPIAEWGGGGTACSITKLFEPFDDKRPSWCPICGVLPEEHGDLIDRDAIWERAGQKKGEADPLRLAAELWCAPVIIAAERKDDD